MSAFQIIILLVIAFIIFKATKKKIKKELSWTLYLLWIIFWLILGAIDLYPVIIEQLATLAGVGRGVDLLIYSSLILLFYWQFKLWLKNNSIEKKNTELIRKLAIAEARRLKNK